MAADGFDLPTLHRMMIVWEATSVLRHDLRNKLASVRNAAFFLQRRVETEAPALVAADARIGTFFGMIRSEADAAVALIADRVPRPVPEPREVDLTNVVAEAIGHLRRPDGVEVSAASERVNGAGDHLELSLATLCLLENAVEAGARSIHVVCRSSEGDGALIEVIDDGPGLGDAADRAFEHFFSTKPGHLGLGLPMAKRLADRSGGSVALHAVADGGVRAVITLPRSTA